MDSVADCLISVAVVSAWMGSGGWLVAGSVVSARLVLLPSVCVGLGSIGWVGSGLGVGRRMGLAPPSSSWIHGFFGGGRRPAMVSTWCASGIGPFRG